MNCPECASVLRTKDTRQYWDSVHEHDWVERRRVCPSCSFKTYTIELPKDVYQRLFTEREGES